MINIIAEERTRTRNPNLNKLNMRIGIHTGKIVGGIIGTKVVRYDIFGQDVLIANKMESNGIGGAVCISEATHQLIMKSDIIKDNFEFEVNKEVEISGIGKKINSYKVTQKIDDDAESSGEYSEEGQE